MLKNGEESRVTDLPHTKHEEIFSHANFPGVSSAEQLIEQQLGPEKTFSKTDLQQSCSQELAKELDLINGGFYDFQERAIRVIGKHLLQIICDTSLSESQKQKKVTELYEHDELYRVLGQYGLKHVALIKLIEKLKHHSFGLSKEQIKELEKYALPRHLQHLKLFIEQQIVKLPPATWQEKQDLIYKVVEVASIYNMSLPEEQRVTHTEIEVLVDTMHDILYNTKTVEEDWRQMLISRRPMKRNEAIEFFSTNYVSNMLKNDKVMTYSPRLDHFLQMMVILKNDLESTTLYKDPRRKDFHARQRLDHFKKFYQNLLKSYKLEKKGSEFSQELEQLCYERMMTTARFNVTPSGVKYAGIDAYVNSIGSNQGYYRDGEELMTLLKNTPGLDVQDIENISSALLQCLSEKDRRIESRKCLVEIQNNIKKMGVPKLVEKLTAIHRVKLWQTETGMKYKNVFQMSSTLPDLEEFIDGIASVGKSVEHIRDFDSLDWRKEALRIRDIIEVVGGKEAAIFFNNVYVPQYETLSIKKLCGNAIGKLVYATGGAAAATRFVDEYFSKCSTSSLHFLIDSFCGKELAEDIFWYSEDEKRQDLLKTTSKAKIQITEFLVGKEQSKRFENALILCDKIEDPVKRKNLQAKLISSISYITLSGVPCIVFPKHVMPYPRAIIDPSPESVQSIFGGELLGDENYRSMKKRGKSSQQEYEYCFDDLQYKNQEMLDQYVPSTEMYSSLVDWFEFTKEGVFEKQFVDGQIIAELCNLDFPDTNLRGLWSSTGEGFAISKDMGVGQLEIDKNRTREKVRKVIGTLRLLAPPIRL